MKKLVILSVILMIAPTVLGARGVLRPVSVKENRHPLYSYSPRTRLRVQSQNEQFTKRTDGDGTVSKHARIARLSGPALPGLGSLMVAIDAESADAEKPDVLRLDFTGQGQFEGSPGVPLRVTWRGTHMEGAVGPTVVQVEVQGKTLSVLVSGRYVRRLEDRSLYLDLVAALQGTCRFGETVCKVWVLDGNGDFQCGDALQADLPRLFRPGDMLVVDRPGEGETKVFYGQRVQVGGKWYEVKVSPDASQISAEEVAVRMAAIRVPHDKWSATLLSSNYMLPIAGGREPVEIPADTYVVSAYQEHGPDGRSRFTCAEWQYGVMGKTFEILPGQTVELAVGSPLQAEILVLPGTWSVYPVGKPGQQVQFRLDGIDGRVVGTLITRETGGWEEYEVQTTPMEWVSGVHDLYVTFAGGSGLGNIEWFRFRYGQQEVVRVIAGRFAKAEGVRVDKNNSDRIGYIDDGDWVRYPKVDFSSGVDAVDIKIAVRGRGKKPTRDKILRLVLTDAAGARVTSLTDPRGSRPPAPKLEVFDPAGQKVHGAAMKYG